MTARGRLLAPLKDRSFRLLWLGQAASAFGDSLQFLALSWLVLDLTGSPLALSGMFLAATVPRIVFTLAGGVATDRYDARDVMVWADALRALVVAGVAVLALGATLPLPILYGLVILQATAGAFFTPAVTSIIPRLVVSEQLQAANSLQALTQQMAYVFGAPLGGIAVAVLGSAATLGINATTFAIAAICTTQVPRILSQEVRTSGVSVISEARAGIAYVIGLGWLRTLFTLDALLAFVVAGPVTVGLPLLIRDRSGNGAESFGVLLGAFSAGMVIGLLIAGAAPAPRKPGAVYCGLVLFQAPCLIALGLLPFATGIVSLAALGLLSGAAEVVWRGLVQARVVSSLLGRVLSISALVVLGVQPVSQITTGMLANEIGVTPLFTAAGLAVALFSIISLLVPTLRSMD